MSDSRKCWHCGGILKRNKADRLECVEHGCDLVTAKPVGTSYHTPLKHSDEPRSMGEGMRRFPTTGLNNR